MIKEFKTSKGEFLVVLVPDDSQDFALEISLEDDLCQLEYLLENTDVDSGFCGDWVTHSVDLPIFDYKIIGIQNEITEQQAKEIVPTEQERHPEMNLYINYTEESTRRAYLLKTALESFNSLMQKLEMTDGKWLIIQKIK